MAAYPNAQLEDRCPVPALGDAALDDEHRTFLNLAHALRLGSPDAARSRLCDLLEHARAHFAAEDLDLRAMRSGNASCHIDEHAAVISSLQAVRDLLESPDIDETAKRRVIERLAASLVNWLPAHVREMDSAVAAHRLERRWGAAPVHLRFQKKPGGAG